MSKGLGSFLNSQFNTVPQPKRISNKTFCAKEEDKCFDKHGNFNCFRCFDGKIILKRQVCDGLIDCFDLSDECTCETSELKQLCDVFYNNTRLHQKPGDFNIICNLQFDLPEGIDEKFCNTNMLFYSDDYIYESFFKKHKCAKGKTAFNHSVYLSIF